MTTVTLITGDPNSGKLLVGESLMKEIIDQGKTVTLARKSEENCYNGAELDDLLIVSSSTEIEPWMEYWFQRYGQPLFRIHITRATEK